MTYLFEFIHVGSYVKISVIEAEHNLEVSIVGDPKQPRKTLEQIAVRKLHHVHRALLGPPPRTFEPAPSTLPSTLPSALPIIENPEAISPRPHRRKQHTGWSLP